MGYAIILSGQGSERLGMLKGIVEKYDFAKKLVAIAEKMFEINLYEIINSNDRNKIIDPKINQIMIFLFHNIYYQLIIGNLGIKPNFIAGHSVGQLCSYSISGTVSIEEMLVFLKKRTDIINDDTITIRAQFYNCFGVTYEDMDRSIRENGLQNDIDIGLHNQEKNVVVAVTEKGKEKLYEMASRYKFIIKKLEIARPYHTHFMEEYNRKLVPVIQKMNFKRADIPILLNNKCKLECDGDMIKRETEVQMIKPVFWYESLNQVKCDNFVVLDPSQSQSKILSKIVSGNIISVYNISCLKNIKIH